MKAGMAADPEQSSRATLLIGGIVASVSGWIRHAAKYLLRLRHPASTESRVHTAIATTRTAQIADSIDAKLTATESFTTAPTADVGVRPVPAKSISQTGPHPQEVERRRALVRTLFNDFWDGAHNKPSAFAQRLDQAEDYLNARLAAYGELWRLDASTRLLLGLPRRSGSPD